MKAIQTNTDARRLLYIFIKKYACVLTWDRCNVISFSGRRKGFFFLFFSANFSFGNFLKAIEIVIHSLIQRIFMLIGLEICAKTQNRTRKRSLHCVDLHCFNSIVSFHTKITTNIFAYTFTALSSIIANNIFQQHLVFLSSLCVGKDLTINIL